jgi:phosphomannomutase/phosphoglucomutase
MRIDAAALPTEIFKAYDIRGVVGRTLTEENVRHIGHAIGSEAIRRQQSSVAVGRDGRLSGPALADALSSGLTAAGCDVIDVGQVPTPLLYFATHELGTGSGVAVTGSHNPPDYNGLKIMLGGETLAGETIQALRQRLIDGELAIGSGQIRHTTVTDAYLDRVTGDVTLQRPLRLVVDCGNGVAGGIAPELYGRLGCDVVELFCEVDGTFPNHHPDPSQESNLQDLIATVQSTQADLGFAFDGDGDRLGVVSANGAVIWPDRQMLLFAEDILSRQPGVEFIYDVKCSRTLPAAIRAAGGRATMWKTGHSFIKAKLKETGAALGGEMSGHLFFNDRWYGFDDALYAGARLLQLLSSRPESPTAVFDALPDSINTPELRLEMVEGEHYDLVDQLVANAEFPDAEVSNIDGLRVDFADGFGLVRASNTTPMLIFRFEADDVAKLDAIQDRFRSLIHGTRADLVLPF